MEIHQVIDRLNAAWGEEHEKKRKKIFNDNVFRIPLVGFIGLTILYFVPLLICLPSLIFSPGKSEYLPIEILEPWFNFPYYMFDLRAFIIVSVVSVLLSLYVSVGKFADGAGGIAGESRRAAYRQFAKIVGCIVSAAFALNFWHGLLAGYFQGNASIPYPFKSWINSPELGVNIVPDGVNLSRYGEMPLWVLLFFGWFTAASCFMLTYNEKDILIKNAYLLNKLKKVADSDKKYTIAEYEMAQCEYEIYSSKSLSNKNSGIEVKSSDSTQFEYGDIFLLDREVVGFNVSISQWPSVWILKFLKIAVFWLLLVLVSLTYPGGNRVAFLVSSTLFLVVCFCAYLNYGRMCLFLSIYNFNKKILNSDKKSFLIFWEFHYQKIFNRLLVWSTTFIACLYPISNIYRNFSGLDIGSDGLIGICVYFSASLAVAIFLIWLFERTVKGTVESIIKKHSEDTLSEKTKEIGIKSNKIDYILLSYIYCSMRNVYDMYSEYKSEIDAGEVEEEKQETDVSSHLMVEVEYLNIGKDSI